MSSLLAQIEHWYYSYLKYFVLGVHYGMIVILNILDKDNAMVRIVSQTASTAFAFPLVVFVPMFQKYLCFSARSFPCRVCNYDHKNWKHFEALFFHSNSEADSHCIPSLGNSTCFNRRLQLRLRPVPTVSDYLTTESEALTTSPVSDAIARALPSLTSPKWEVTKKGFIVHVHMEACRSDRRRQCVSPLMDLSSPPPPKGGTQVIKFYNISFSPQMLISSLQYCFVWHSQKK